MKSTLRVFKTYGAAQKYAAGKPIIQIEWLYLVSSLPAQDVGLISCELLIAGSQRATVTMNHLCRLGNANHASAKPGYAGCDFREMIADHARISKVKLNVKYVDGRKQRGTP